VFVLLHGFLSFVVFPMDVDFLFLVWRCVKVGGVSK
jgi:hypothetical protein